MATRKDIPGVRPSIGWKATADFGHPYAAPAIAAGGRIVRDGEAFRLAE